MKTNVVAPQELGRSAGGATASKGWSQVKQYDPHCGRAHKISKPPSMLEFSTEMEDASKGATRIVVFTPGKPPGRSRPPSTGVKLIPISRTKCGRRNALLSLRR
jgi:hypothetical protein